jgi:predicted MFS family arabinose efflux permease
VGQRRTVSDTLVVPGLRVILFASAAYMVAHNILYTYVSDFLRHAGMEGQTGIVLSTLVVGTHIDRHLRTLVAGSTVLFALSVLVLAALSDVPALVYIAAAAWGFAFGNAATAAVTAGRKHAFPNRA